MKPLNDILRMAVYEYRSILGSLPILMVLGGGIFLYGLLYNYMYSPNVLRDVPMVVVDESHTPLSRQYIRLLDALRKSVCRGWSLICRKPVNGCGRERSWVSCTFPVISMPR